MPNGGLSKDTFERSDTNSKLRILYDQQHEIIESLRNLKTNNSDIANNCHTQWKGCDDRFKKIERNWYKVVGAILFLAAAAPAFVQYVIA